jgi:hypothetical protein
MMGDADQARAAQAERASREATRAEDAILGEPGEIRWEGAIFERVTSIERQLDALDEGLAKRVPELEGRLLHLLERRLGALEADLHRRVSDLATDVALDADRSRSDQRRVLWCLAALGALILLF